MVSELYLNDALFKKQDIEKYDSYLKNKMMDIDINFWLLFMVRVCFNLHRWWHVVTWWPDLMAWF